MHPFACESPAKSPITAVVEIRCAHNMTCSQWSLILLNYLNFGVQHVLLSHTFDPKPIT